MEKMYDIFVSYRRVDSEGRASGRDIARTIKLELEKRRYKVFFDYSEIKDGYFEEIILPAVQNSKIFILVLSKDALNRCSYEGDWVHREILKALQSRTKVIPVDPDGQFNGWPPNLPVDISSIKKIQISEIATNSLFETSIDKLENDRIKPIMLQSRLQTNAFSNGFNFSTRPVSTPYATAAKKPSPTKPTKKKEPFMKQIKEWMDGKAGDNLMIIGGSLLTILFVFFLWKCSDIDNTPAVKIVEQDGKAGLVLEGDTVLPCQYDSIWRMSDGFMFFKDDKRGWVSHDGDIVLPCEFKSIYSSDAFLIVEEENGLHHLYNNKGVRLTKNTYRYLRWGNGDGLGIVQDLNYKYGYIDSLGNEVITCKYFDANDFSEGKAFVKMSASETMKCIDKSEQVLFTTPYHDAEYYSEGLAYVSNYFVGGFINELGQLVIPMKYGMIKNEKGWITIPAFHDGTAPVSLEGVNGHVDKQGHFTPDD